MKQSEYENILACINYGVPALANNLIKAFNETISLANERITEKQEEERRKTEAELKRQQDEKIKKESNESNVTKKK